ncbi:hypothetical protein D9756_001280 [Leucocoprinus leucothites]|uniref:NACHT domain-containing protein n=1 Tax=Leucocoprinus leucothites TaxID=201217 RepID=A0A8H5G472_9AGAR|nr:hypothetical protein D9756_001280 [Leucoagaricus leucothites]
MPLDSFIDPLISGARRLIGRKSRRSTREQVVHYSGCGPVQGAANAPSNPSPEQHASGYFTNAHHLVFNNPIMVENMFVKGKTVLEILHPHTMPDAAVDSSARNPPPKCHPGTRIRIRDYLEYWLDDPYRQHDMTWIYGPAGTGKSAIAQTFAELCAERDRLGAAIFFSRPNKRNRPETVVPTLVYQLSIHCLAYKSIVAHVLSDDPQLLDKTPHVQFKQLIVDPFSFLQYQGHESVRQPFLVLLDGLDECSGKRSQGEFIRLISELVRLKRGFPILWLLCSRPEPHLKHAFSRISECAQKRLSLNLEYRKDIEKFLQNGFTALKDEYEDMMPLTWPSERQLKRLLHITSGPFMVAAFALKYIGDPDYANPVKRLEKLLASFAYPLIAEKNRPLSAIDALYIRALEDIPEDVFPTVRRILAHLLWLPRLSYAPRPTCQALCNLLRYDQATFYGALRHLHSFYYIPKPEHAANQGIYAYHASFDDFISFENRSDRFYIDRKKAYVEVAKTLLFWHELDTKLFHNTEEPDPDTEKHEHGCFPGLPWVSTDNQDQISKGIAHQAMLVWASMSPTKAGKDDDLYQQIQTADFRYVRGSTTYFMDVVYWVLTHYPSSTIVHTEPSNDVDYKLLEYLKIFTNNEPVKPSTSPETPTRLRHGREFREYFFFGYGARTILLLLTRAQKSPHDRLEKMNADGPPSENHVLEYQQWLRDSGWSGGVEEAKMTEVKSIPDEEDTFMDWLDEYE